MPCQVYINGKFFPQDEAKVSVFDHGLLYGDGVFEGLRAYRGKTLYEVLFKDSDVGKFTLSEINGE